MLAAGVNVCIGTDSLASNPSLSVLDELRHIRCIHPDFDGSILLELATIRGADALGLKDELGSLTPDKSADLTVVPFDLSGHNDPIENLLVSTAQPVATYIRGKRVDRQQHSPRPR
jgi:cytosine/adenosine deaminase-related metal-dependent hydrolase